MGWLLSVIRTYGSPRETPIRVFQKRDKRGKNMPYTNPKHKTRHQRQQRRTGQVRRVEIVLSATNERDYDIHDFLETLPQGAVGEFIRTAIIEKIQREQAQPAPETPSASAQFNAILAELAALRQAVSPPVPMTAATSSHPATRHIEPPDPTPELTESSGLDMSRPRPRKIPARAPTLPLTLPEEKPFDPDECRRLLVQSIKAFGQNSDR